MKPVDLSGKVFGQLTVIGRAEEHSSNGNSVWACECDCGNLLTVPAPNLKSGNTKSCGCSKGLLARDAREKKGLSKNLSGKTFGRLAVVRKSEHRSGTNPMWDCICICGTYTTAIQENLLNGHTKSCGCASSRNNIGNLSRTHGMSNERLYNVWRSMKSRCENPKTEQYPNYGGRGIRVCVQWHNYQDFYNWAMANGYDVNAEFGQCTIDRINVDGNYHPENCRWVDMKIQAKNKRRSLRDVSRYRSP